MYIHDLLKNIVQLKVLNKPSAFVCTQLNVFKHCNLFFHTVKQYQAFLSNTNN